MESQKFKEVLRNFEIIKQDFYQNQKKRFLLPVLLWTQI